MLHSFFRNKSTFWKIKFFYFKTRKISPLCNWYTGFLPKKRALLHVCFTVTLEFLFFRPHTQFKIFIWKSYVLCIKAVNKNSLDRLLSLKHKINLSQFWIINYYMKVRIICKELLNWTFFFFLYTARFFCSENLGEALSCEK